MTETAPAFAPEAPTIERPTGAQSKMQTGTTSNGATASAGRIARKPPRPDRLVNSAKARAVSHANARQRNRKLAALVAVAREQGVASWAGLAEWLNRRGCRSPRGCPWKADNVRLHLLRVPPERPE